MEKTKYIHTPFGFLTESELNSIRVRSQHDIAVQAGLPMMLALVNCPHCHKNTVDESWCEELITSCKFCNSTFCD
jgi:hypothetical protein